MKFEQLVDLIAHIDPVSVGRNATDEEIRAAELRLGVPIRGSYRTFLLTFGWGSFQHLEILGLGVDVPPYLNLVMVTESERTEMKPRLPRHLLPIMNDGAGNLYCLDTNPDEPTVVFWDHDAGEHQTPSLEGDNFIDWLARMLNALA